MVVCLYSCNTHQRSGGRNSYGKNGYGYPELFERWLKFSIMKVVRWQFWETETSNLYLPNYMCIFIVPGSLAKRHSSLKAFLVKYIATFPKAFSPGIGGKKYWLVYPGIVASNLQVWNVWKVGLLNRCLLCSGTCVLDCGHVLKVLPLSTSLRKLTLIQQWKFSG